MSHPEIDPIQSIEARLTARAREVEGYLAASGMVLYGDAVMPERDARRAARWQALRDLWWIAEALVGIGVIAGMAGVFYLLLGILVR